MSRYSRQARFSELKGKVILEIKGMEVGGDKITFICADGSEYIMHHIQDCCETVEIDDVAGDINDLIGSPIIVAEENSNDDLPKRGEWDDSYTWTFYKLATEKGYVDLKWYGTSNGYYSERVDFEKNIRTIDDMYKESNEAIRNIWWVEANLLRLSDSLAVGDIDRKTIIGRVQDELNRVMSFLDVCEEIFRNNVRYGKD